MSLGAWGDEGDGCIPCQENGGYCENHPMVETEAVPCPFCGADAERNDAGRYSCSHRNGECPVVLWVALETWNRRAGEEQPRLVFCDKHGSGQMPCGECTTEAALREEFEACFLLGREYAGFSEATALDHVRAGNFASKFLALYAVPSVPAGETGVGEKANSADEKLAKKLIPAGVPDRAAVIEALNEMENAAIEWARDSKVLSARTLNARAALLALIFPTPAVPAPEKHDDK